MRTILVTGSRHWDDARAIAWALLDHTNPGDELIHGDAVGADRLADELGHFYFDLDTRAFPFWDFDSPLKRNDHMVSLGPDLCLAFALTWASGTGHCARRARKAGIPVIDFGESTE